MPNEELLVEILECQHDTKVGHITLNSPETLNSLTMNMVNKICLLYTSPSPRDRQKSRMPSSA